jgi:hypothetical protein
VDIQPSGASEARSPSSKDDHAHHARDPECLPEGVSRTIAVTDPQTGCSFAIAELRDLRPVAECIERRRGAFPGIRRVLPGGTVGLE